MKVLMWGLLLHSCDQSDTDLDRQHYSNNSHVFGRFISAIHRCCESTLRPWPNDAIHHSIFS